MSATLGEADRGFRRCKFIRKTAVVKRWQSGLKDLYSRLESTFNTVD